jgi:glycosyltransferase involved in cell wall biosynthesis
MRIAYYAPLKSPNHPVPSGDRRMAQLLMEALGRAGHTVELVSEFRSFLADPDEADYAARKKGAEAEIARIAQEWSRTGKPDLWFCYHPYYKAPDLMGPRLAARCGIPYATAEASWSPRRFVGPWAAAQDNVLAALRQASLNVCFTRRDLEGLSPLASAYRLAMLPPFLDTEPFPRRAEGGEPPRLIAVAMMRPGVKTDSYRMLARALRHCLDLPWTLRIVGDGSEMAAVRDTMSPLGDDRVEWMGEQQPEAIPSLLAESDILAWPGTGEAYGMTYLEGQAAGLPVVAQDTAGVPEVVRNGETGLLVPLDDDHAYADAIRSLLVDADRRRAMGDAARSFVLEERSLDRAASILKALLSRFGT